MLTLQMLIDDLKQYHNDICIVYDSELIRLVGVAEDEDDLYYIGKDKRGKKTWYSAVGHLVSLKGRYPDLNYENMAYVFDLNGGTAEPEFEIVKYPPVAQR